MTGPAAGTPPLVSVVVPTFRRPDLLARCLAALAAQRLDAAAFEVVVADDGDSAETRGAVEQAAARAPMSVRYLALTAPGRHGPAAARNAGWRAAAGDIVAFTDDDCLPDPGWLAAGLAAFSSEVAGEEAGEVVAVTGRVVVPRPAVPTDYQRNTAGLEQAELVTANCFCRREALAAVGGFDERFPLAWREDSDLHFNLLEGGGRCVRAPEAVVVHPVREARWGVSIAEQKKTVYNALLYKKHPRLYRERIQPSPPWASYATLAALATALVSAAAGRPRQAALAAALWGGLTGRVCARRLAGTSQAPAHVAEMLVTSAVIPSLSAFWRLAGAWRYRVPFL